VQVVKLNTEQPVDVNDRMLSQAGIYVYRPELSLQNNLKISTIYNSENTYW